MFVMQPTAFPVHVEYKHLTYVHMIAVGEIILSLKNMGTVFANGGSTNFQKSDAPIFCMKL